MNLYKISQSVNAGWYTYDSAIVVASSKDAARKIIPSPFYFYDGGFYYKYRNQEPAKEKLDPSWCNPTHVNVELVGTTELPERTVVNASFNAGFDESRYLDMRRLGRTIAEGRLTETGLIKAISTLEDMEMQTHDKGLAELRYHLIEANRVHDLARVQEYELKVMDYTNQEWEDWS